MAPTATATTSIMLELRKYLMLMAILAATVTYGAGLNPPGGVWLRTEDGHLTGDQVLVHTGRRRYNAFYYSNAAAFMASVVVILLLLLMERSTGKSNKLLVLAALRVVMVLDFFAVLVAYAAGASRGTATTVVASLLVSAVSVYITGYAAYRALFRPRPPPESPGDASLNLRLERRRKILMLFCIFAATVTYTAGLNPPGGFWPDGREGSRPGSPVLEDRHHSWRFIAFFVCNTVAFIASLRGIMLLTTIRSKFQDGDGNGRWWYVLYGHVVLALTGLFIAYGFGSCRETRSTVYVFGPVFPVLAYTAVQFFIQRYWWDKIVDRADQIKCRLSSYWTSLRLRLPSWWSSMCFCLADPDEQNTIVEDAPPGAETTPVKRAHTAVLLLATLAATITYQAGMNPPGGFWPDSRDGHAGGDPILLTTHAKRYKVFFAFNSLALVTSIVVIAMVLTRNASSAVHRHHALEAAMILDLLSLVVSYAVGCGRDVNTSVRVIALGGGILVFVVIYIVFFTLKTARETPELLKKKRKLLLLFAILVVTITYQAGLTPPGGFWLEDDADANHHAAGYAVLADTYPHRYAAFFYCNAVSFMSSVAIIVLLVNPHMYELGIMCQALYLCAVSALLSLIGSYAAGSSRRLGTSLSMVALVAGVFVFIMLLLLALKFLRRGKIFCRGSNELPSPLPQEGGGEEEPKEKEACAMEGHDSDVETQPQHQEAADHSNEESQEGGGDDSETAKYTTRKYLMVVSILVASVTYQAGLIPPGGVWPDSVDGHAAGNPVLHDSNERRYSLFFYSNSISFLASIVVIFLLQLDEPLFALKFGSPSRATISSKPESDEMLRVAQSSTLLALLFLLFAYASGCSRRWEMFGYVVVLVAAVLLYIAIHVLLSCSEEKPAQLVTPLAQEGEHGGDSGHCTDGLCRCKCHEKDGERTEEEIEV